LLRRTLAARFGGKKTDWHFFNPETPAISRLLRKIFRAAGNKPRRWTVLNRATSVAFNNRLQRDHRPMTISTRIALGVSAAALSFSLALAPAAFAQDSMKKEDGMMKKDTMKKDDGMKKDSMMKKDDAMKKDNGMMKKDDKK
jgi:pentapeptide MXKDX repeat protein